MHRKAWKGLQKKPKAHENKSLETIKYSFSGRDESAKEVFIDLGKKGDTTSERHIVTLRLTLKIRSMEKSKIPTQKAGGIFLYPTTQLWLFKKEKQFLKTFELNHEIKKKSFRP